MTHIGPILLYMSYYKLYHIAYRYYYPYIGQHGVHDQYSYLTKDIVPSLRQTSQLYLTQVTGGQYIFTELHIAIYH